MSLYSQCQQQQNSDILTQHYHQFDSNVHEINKQKLVQTCICVHLNAQIIPFRQKYMQHLPKLCVRPDGHISCLVRTLCPDGMSQFAFVFLLEVQTMKRLWRDDAASVHVAGCLGLTELTQDTVYVTVVLRQTYIHTDRQTDRHTADISASLS